MLKHKAIKMFDNQISAAISYAVEELNNKNYLPNGHKIK